MVESSLTERESSSLNPPQAQRPRRNSLPNKLPFFGPEIIDVNDFT